MSSAFDQVGKFYTKQFDTASAAAAITTKSWQEIASSSADYASKWVENSRQLTEKLAGAKNLEETFKLQSDFFKTAYEDFVAHTTKIGSLYSDLAKEATKRLQEQTGPISSS